MKRLILFGFFAASAFAHAAQKIQFDVQLGPSLCNMKNSEEIIECQSGPIPSIETFTTELTGEDCTTDCLTYTADFKKTFTFIWQEKKQTTDVDLRVIIAQMNIRGQRSYILSATLKPAQGKRADERSSHATIKDLACIESIDVISKASIEKGAKGQLVEKKVTATISNFQLK